MIKYIQHGIRLVRHSLNKKKTAARRSSHWPRVEKDFLKKNPVCAACGGQVRLNVHHLKPFHLDPALELDETNLVTLCMELGKHDHLLIGHGDNFSAFNPEAVLDAAKMAVAYRYNDTETLAKLRAEVKAKRKTAL